MKYILFAAVVLSTSAALAQSSAVQTLIIPRGIRLPKDSMTRAGLIGSLENWLDQRKKPDSMNAYVSRAELPATTVFMDELRSIDWYLRQDSAASCKCYLGNVVSLDSAQCLVQLNYMDMRKDTPMLRACCTVLARRGDNNRWIVSSPLEQNTVGWKEKTIGNCVFHYKTTINVRKAEEFVRGIASYDKRLKAVGTTIDFYCCNNWVEATKLLGEDFRADYNGSALAEFSSDYGNRTVVVSGEPFVDGFNTWDTHDWWHGRLHRIVPTATINRPVDEGMAYLYGGSWRIYGWKDVLNMIETYAAANPGADWLELYKKGTNLQTQPWPLKISYTINALVVQRLERDKGFYASLPLLSCGPKQEGDANYFAAFKKVTGVDEAGFNSYVSGLLKDAAGR